MSPITKHQESPISFPKFHNWMKLSRTI